MRRQNKLLFLAVFLSGLILGPTAEAAESKDKNVILSTTTSTQDSGLLDVLVPLFEKQTGYSVKTVSVGTGQALALAAKGDADVALVHRGRAGYGSDLGNCQRARRLHDYGPWNLSGPAEAGDAADFGGKGQGASEHLFGDGGESCQW